VRVQPRQRQAGEEHRKEPTPAPRLVRRAQPVRSSGAQCPARGEGAVREQEAGTSDPHDVDERRHRGECGSRSGHAGDDEDGVGRDADRHHGDDVLAEQSLAQHKRVLGADRDDEREAEAQTRQGGEECWRGHGPTVSGSSPEAQFAELRWH
jgi:hypothetical protein